MMWDYIVDRVKQVGYTRLAPTVFHIWKVLEKALLNKIGFKRKVP
jgi:hypothetical protein